MKTSRFRLNKQIKLIQNNLFGHKMQFYTYCSFRNLEPFSSPIFGKLLSSIAIPIWKKISELLVRPKIKLKKAPKNVFEYIKPTSSKDLIKDLLGAPHNVLESKWCYEFLDAAIQIDFNDDSGAKYIVLGLQGIK